MVDEIPVPGATLLLWLNNQIKAKDLTRLCKCKARKCEWDGPWVRKNRQRHKAQREDTQTLLCICFHLARLSSVLFGFLFSPIRRLAVRGDATLPDYSVYCRFDASFITSLAALLDWHSSLDCFTIALYLWISSCSLNTDKLNLWMGNAPRILTLKGQTCRSKDKYQWTQAIRVVRLTRGRQGDLLCSVKLFLGYCLCSLDWLSPANSRSPAFVVRFLCSIIHTSWYIIWLHTLFHLFM